MKIALIGTAHPYRGGLAAYNEKLATELQLQGHDVTIYTFTVQYPSFLFPGKTQYSTEPAPTHLKIIRCVNSVNPLNWWSIGNKIKKERPDLVITKYWLPVMGPCFGSILRIIKGNGYSKVITILDNIIPHESRIGDTAFTKYFVKPVDGFIAMSQSVLNDLRQFTQMKNVKLSPHPLFDNFGKVLPRETALTKLGLDPNYKYILFFGLIRKYKGLDLLIEAFADSRFRNSNIKLIIAGEYYADKTAYTDLIKKHNLADDIIQVDKFIPDSEVKLFFSAADLVAQPYKTATQSGVTQIAYHFNKPMVVTDVGGLKELCPDEKVGYVVNDNAPEIANALLRFFNDTDIPQMINNIIEEKKKYSWSILIENVLKLMRNVRTSSKSETLKQQKENPVNI